MDTSQRKTDTAASAVSASAQPSATTTTKVPTKKAWGGKPPKPVKVVSLQDIMDDQRASKATEPQKNDKPQNSNVAAAPLPSAQPSAQPRPLHHGVMRPFMVKPGERRLPFGSWFGQMSKELVVYLQAEPPYSMPSENAGALGALGFKECDDGHKNGGHRYYEGYWHASLDPDNTAKWHEPKPGMNPRYGVPMQKLAAPHRIFAFIQAFRLKNRAFFAGIYEAMADQMATQLDSASEGGPAILHKARNDTAAAVHQCFGHPSGCAGALADVSAQIHFGKSAPPVWHIDAANSLIHFSITLGGERELRWREAETADSAQDQVQTRRLVPGDLYLSSPVAFRHGVQYSRDCAWGPDMVYALQVRLSFSLEQRSKLSDRRWLCQTMAEHIRSFHFQCPSLAEVQTCQQGLAAPPEKSDSTGGCHVM